MPLDFAAFVAPGHTALVSQEIQRGACGDLSQLPELAKAAEAAIPNIARLVEAARRAGFRQECVEAVFANTLGAMVTLTDSGAVLSAWSAA